MVEEQRAWDARAGGWLCHVQPHSVEDHPVSRRGLALFIAMCVIWGIPYLLIKVSLRGSRAGRPRVRPVPARRRVAGADRAHPRRGPPDAPKRWGWIVAYTMIEMGMPWVLLSDAELRISSSLSGLLVSTVPLIGVVIGAADPQWRAPWVAPDPRPGRRAGGGRRARRLQRLSRRPSGRSPRCSWWRSATRSARTSSIAS